MESSGLLDHLRVDHLDVLSDAITIAPESPSIRPEDPVGLEVGDLGATAATNRAVQVITQDLDAARDTFRAVGAQTPERRPPEHDLLGAPGQPLDHIGALRESAVDHDLGAAGDRVDGGGDAG